MLENGGRGPERRWISRSGYAECGIPESDDPAEQQALSSTGEAARATIRPVFITSWRRGLYCGAGFSLPIRSQAEARTTICPEQVQVALKCQMLSRKSRLVHGQG